MNELVARALALFEDCANLSAAERERRLAQLAERDPALHAALCALLASDADGNQRFLRTPSQTMAGIEHAVHAADGARDPRIGTRLGAWRIDRAIGRGRMSTVYEAHRDDGQYQQRVALKCIRADLNSAQLASAFRDERMRLAQLDHPGIAGVVDGAIDAQGEPWLAMRYVDGLPIDVWCDRRRAGIDQRVALLIQACEALVYAHAHAVPHRDLKPSNLLVSEDGRLHLLDFGLSSGGGAADALASDYAAPETREFGVQGPAADLYMLGVLSYRLLSGQWPVPPQAARARDLPAAAPQAMERLLDGADDGVARLRGLRDARALQRALAGDLSAIALKAVAAKPQDRYASVAEFARELQDWRAHRPVAARRSGWAARTLKWRRRNPVAAGLITALLLVSIAGVFAIVWQSRRAEREAAASHAVSDLFASTLGSATVSGLGSTPFSSRALLERTERQLDAMPLGDQPGLHARSLATLARSYAVIGDYRHAKVLADRAERVLGDEQDQDGFVAATRLSILCTQAHYAETIRLARTLIAGLGERQDEVARTSRVVFGAQLAQAQWDLGDTATAVGTVSDLVAQAERLGPGHEELLAQTLILRADFLSRLLRPIPADADARRAIALARPLNPILADDALEKLVRVVQMQPNLQARELARELVQRRKRTLGAAHPKTAYALIRLSIFPGSQVSDSEIVQAQNAIRAAYGTDHPMYVYVLSAGWKTAREDRNQQIVRLREAVLKLERKLPANNERLLMTRYNLGLSLLYDGDTPASRQNTAEGLEVLRQTVANRTRAGLPSMVERHLMATFLIDYGSDERLPELQRLLAQLRAETIALFGARDYRLREIDYAQAKLLFRQGRLGDADRAFADLLAADRDFVATGGTGTGALSDFQTRSTDLIWALLYRGVYALETCRKAQALDYLEQAVALSATAPLRSADADRVARAYLSGARKGRIPDIADHVVGAADRERVNRAAQACRNAHGAHGQRAR